LCKKADHIFIAGGNINSLLKKDMSEYLAEISSHKSQITLMSDGLCASNLEDRPKHVSNGDLGVTENFYDIGMQSLNNLHQLISTHDIIFWNGTLGVVEDVKYKRGSESLVHTLMREIRSHPDKKVIVGGGDTGGFVNKYDHGFTHISTGGGAAIEYITFDTLTGLEIFQ
jgi:phosphoglycerate kinase